MRVSKRKREFALYKGDTFLTAGTLEEIAEERGVKTETIEYYRYPVAQRRNPSKSGKCNRLVLKPLDDEEDF